MKFVPSVIHSIQASRRLFPLVVVLISSIRSTAYRTLNNESGRVEIVISQPILFMRYIYMKSSGIGGQAVIEGVMMKNKDRYAVAVRKPNNEIEVSVKETENLQEKYKILALPIIRGVYSFISSLVVGMSTLTYSASFFDEEENEDDSTKSEAVKVDPAKSERSEKLVMGGTVAFSIVLAVLIFMVAPFYLSRFFSLFIYSETALIAIEGVIRLAIFIAYVKLISLMEDIKRVYMYHGAEHKCINCIEHGLDLTVENVKKSSKEHKRCGTSFLLIVMCVSIVVFMFIRVDSTLLKMVLRVLLVPVIAGLSYEVLRKAGNSDSKFMDIVSKPGLLLQRMTTSEPDEAMIEVGIASVEAVFDWRSYVEEVRKGNL